MLYIYKQSPKPLQAWTLLNVGGPNNLAPDVKAKYLVLHKADVMKLKDRYMIEPEHVNVSPAILTVEKIDQKYMTVDEDKKTDLLLQVLEREKPRQSLIPLWLAVVMLCCPPMVMRSLYMREERRKARMSCRLIPTPRGAPNKSCSHRLR